jgi:hypothetical protein
MKIISCFAYSDGKFRFTEESVTQFDHDVPIYKVNPDDIIYRGVMKHYTLDRLEAEFEHMKDKALGLSNGHESRLNKFSLLPEEINYINGIGAGKPFGQLIGNSDLGLTRTLKLLYSLLTTGVIEVTKAKSIKEVSVEEKQGVRRRPKTIELEDLEDVDAEIDKAAREAGGESGGVVSDYLPEGVEKRPESDKPSAAERGAY